MIFYLAGVGGAQEGVVFYIWVGIFNVFVISQVWAFANDIYTEAQGKRLFPMIGVGSSLGAWLGAQGAEPAGLGAARDSLSASAAGRRDSGGLLRPGGRGQPNRDPQFHSRDGQPRRSRSWPQATGSP